MLVTTHLGEIFTPLTDLLELLKEIFPGSYLWTPSTMYLDSPHDTAIGLIIQPGPQTYLQMFKFLVSNPVSIANWWGHTAIYIRVNGKIVRAIGFDPSRIEMFNIASGVGKAVSSGNSPTQGYYFDEEKMFLSPDMLAVEFPVSEKVANQILESLPSFGSSLKSKGVLQQYVTSGADKHEKKSTW